MDTAEFLRLIWPDTGHYVLATPFKVPGTNDWTYAHKVLDSIDDAVAFAGKMRTSSDIYFAIHSLAERRVWSETKVDRKTGKKGAWQVRVQRNMLAARAFFLDLDVGADERKYPTQQAARADLIQFVDACQLPQPLVVSSGGGLHVYWLADAALPSADWQVHAKKLRRLAEAHKLRFDPMRTTDTSSVLRVVGTLNHKDPTNLRAVKVVQTGDQTATNDLIAQLDAALVRADVPADALPRAAAPKAPLSEVDEILGGNLDKDLPKTLVRLKPLADACAQVRWFMTQRGNVSEPEWYAHLGLMHYVERGTKLAHAISAGHPSYTEAETDAKLAQLKTLTGPTTCAKFQSVCATDRCTACPHFGKVTSPVVAAKYHDVRPAPVVSVSLGDDDDGMPSMTSAIPDPPEPFKRLKTGVAMKVELPDGDEKMLVIYENDLYPIRRVVNAEAKSEQHVWRVELPREGAKDFVMDADALYDGQKFIRKVAHQGIYPKPGNIKNLQEYMVAYISRLQREQDAEPQKTHLGWDTALESFTLPDKILKTDGTVRPASLSPAAESAVAQVYKQGTLERQVELLTFYNHREYLPNQLYIMCGLGTPYFYSTGHYGVIINASGEPGASKSTTLYALASLWGAPDKYPLSGTALGATPKARYQRITTLSNLPVAIDEITNMPLHEARELVMSISQATNRVRLEGDGTEQRQNDQHKSTITFTNANSSLHNLLSTDNTSGTAGSMRVIEMAFRAQTVHKKFEADTFLRELRKNHGHIGERVLAKCIANQAEVEQAIQRKVIEIDEQARIQSAERFWSGAPAAGIVIGEIAREQGLLAYNPAEAQHWYVREQIPAMRGVVQDEYATPIGLLATYLDSHTGSIIVTKGSAHGAHCEVISRPHNEMVGHFDLDHMMMYVSKAAFKDWCARRGANSTQILQALMDTETVHGAPRRVVMSHNLRRVLGAGTDYAKARAYCFTVDMTHPEVASLTDFPAADGIDPARWRREGNVTRMM